MGQPSGWPILVLEHQMPGTTTALVLPLLLVLGSAAANGQVLASEADRREAFKHYRAGQELLSSEQWDKAAEAFQLSIKYDPLLTDAHYGLGQAHMGQQRYTSAIQAFERCIESARSLHRLREKDRVSTDRAIDEEIRELKDSMRRVGSGQVRVAQPNIKLTQLQQRIDELERNRSSMGAAFEAPATVLLSLGSAHFRNGARDQAEHYWSESVKANSRLGEAWNNLAVIYLGSGRKQEAEDAVKSAERAGFRVNPRLKDDIKAMKP
jgi:tetratricopeptide (TPR) repeat protein